MLRTDLFGNTLLTGESQRKNGTYMFRIMKWGRNNCVYDKSIEGLRAKEKILLESINRGYSVLNEEMNLNDIVDFYLERKSRYLQESTLHTMYHEYYGCRNTIGRVRIKELRYSDIMYFFMGRVKTEKNKGGYAISTIERKLSVITGALEMALKDRIIDWNPATGVITEVKKIAKYQSNKVEGLTENQKDRIINYMNENPKYAKDRQIILFLLGTGCRVSEALALRWEDIDFENNYISINHAITYKNENNHRVTHIKAPKTKAGNRLIPMMNDVRELLLEIKREHNNSDYEKQEIDGYTDFVFLSNKGCVFTREAICAKLHRIIKSYNNEYGQNKFNRIPLISTNQLRHTFATFLCRSTSDHKAVQIIMGHEDISLTLGTYADATEVGVVDAIKSLEKVYFLKNPID